MPRRRGLRAIESWVYSTNAVKLWSELNEAQEKPCPQSLVWGKAELKPRLSPSRGSLYPNTQSRSNILKEGVSGSLLFNWMMMEKKTLEWNEKYFLGSNFEHFKQQVGEKFR